ncbi:hypothetical protein SISNIDRAFT_538847 [Sistotremastrum niveocremeum HHB9708]|uniref:Uncharacterized protein n=1 Tax=Sistotremastrum niveocremeum HHB9708 TaxID=1314777 RepID=A0A164X8Y7_9AGAM|nr:hypothetical protein SISNIDRAFT_538847 [Sistotremastrum niveocremeum HHB9708]
MENGDLVKNINRQQALFQNQLTAVAGVLEAGVHETRNLLSNVLLHGERQKLQENDRWETGSMSLLRNTTSSLENIKTMIASAISFTIADISEESNLCTRLCRLPDAVTLKILAAYCYEDLHGDGSDANPANGVFRLRRNWTKLTEVCRHWNKILKRSPEFWSFIDLSWPIELIDYHVGLSQGAPLKVRWNLPMSPSEALVMTRYHSRESTDPPSVSRKWNLVCAHWLGDVQLSVEGKLTGDKVTQLTNLLDLYPPTVKALRIYMRLEAGSPQVSISLPPLLMSNLSTLRLHYCGASGPFSPLLETIEVVGGNMTVNDIFQILSGCQVLKSGTFDVNAGAFLPPATWALRTNPLRLPHMKRLKLGRLSEATFEWLYTRILLEEVPNLEVILKFPHGTGTSFLLPARFQTCASRAHSLSVWRTDQVKYHFDTQHVHEFRLNYDLPMSPLYLRYQPTLSFSPFKFLRRLLIGTFSPHYLEFWVQTLHHLPYLTNIHIRGCQTKFSAILKAFCYGAPLYCPQLSILSLEDSEDDSWKWDEGTTEESASLQSEATDDCLEHLLRCRAAKGIPIQKLILSGYSWWDEGPERWNPLVGSVVLNEDMWTDPW